MKRLIALLLIATQAWAGLPPPTVQGQSGTKLNAKFDHQVPFNQATDLGGTKALIETGNQNLLLDANFQGVYTANLAAGWTLSTATAVKDTTNFIDGNVSQQVSVTAQTGELSQDVTPTIQTNGVPMVSACMVKTTGTDVQVCARTNATDISCSTVASNGNWVLQPVNFTGPANGTSVGVSVKNTASSTETYNVGKCYVGVSSTPQNFGQVSQAQKVGQIKISGCASAWNTTSTTFADFGTQTGCTYTITGSGISAPATNIPGFQLTGGPGEYQFVVTGFYGAANSGNLSSYFQMYDGTTASNEQPAVNGTSTTNNLPGGSMQFTLSYTTAQSSTSVRVRGKVDSTGQTNIYGSSTYPLTIDVYKFPSASEIAYRPDVLPASWSGSLNGTFTNTSTGSLGDFSGSGVSVSQLSNTNFGTVSAAAGSVAGLTFTPSRAGSYLVCSTFSASESSAGTTTNVFSMLDGSGNTLISGSGLNYPAANNNSAFSGCGILNAGSTAPVTVKWKEFAGGATTVTVSGFSFSITALNQQMPAPLLMGSVTSTSTGQEHIERVRISNNGTATISSQSGSWVSSVSRTGVGLVTVNFTSGEFSGTPSCTCTVEVGSRVCAISGGVISSSSVNLDTSTSNTATDEDRNFDLICMGPR